MSNKHTLTADTLNWSTNTDEQVGFWQQYDYYHGYGNTSIIFRCSICGFHPCDHNLGAYRFCPRCGTPMIAPPGPVIEIDASQVEKSEPFCPYAPAYCDVTDFSSCKDCEILKESSQQIKKGKTV